MGNVLFKTNNILSIKNTARPQGDLGGTFSHSYTYDDLSRLTGANGVCRDTISYALQMAYDIMSNPLQKTQTVTGSDIATSHDLHFAYGHSKPNAVTEISGTRYEYDLNGNPTLIATDSTHREMAWDEENRMLSLNDDGYVSRYTYDHTGTRTVKSHGPMEAVYVNGAPQRDSIYLNWLNPDPLTEKYPMYSAYSYCYSNPVRFNDPTGLFGSEEEANNYHTELGGSAAKIWQAEDGRWHVTMSKDGTDYYRPSEGAEVVKYQSTWAKINTFFAEGNAAPANEGNITVQDVRATANGMEAISDASDAAGTGLIITGVVAETGVALYGVGTVTGFIGDMINIGVDVYEGKYNDAITRSLGTLMGHFWGKKINTGNKTADSYARKSIDKTMDSVVSNSLNKK